jgi:hypothetical protein
MKKESLNTIFDYNDGQLFWKVERNGTKGIGSLAGCLDRNGYVVVCFDGKPRKAHRIIYTMHFGEIPEGKEIDHENLIRTDNRIENLRIANHGQNQQNGKKYKNNTSGFKGVYYYPPDRWRARISVNNKDICLGFYSTKEEAASAYQEGANRLHKQFANY